MKQKTIPLQHRMLRKIGRQEVAAGGRNLRKKKKINTNTGQEFAVLDEMDIQ